MGTVEVAGVNDLEVLSAACTIDDLVFAVEPVIPLKRYRITARLKDTATVGQRVGRIVLTLKEGALVESHELLVYGTVAESCP